MLTSTLLLNTLYFMKATELKRWLAQQGCTFETHKGGSGHLTVRRGDRKSQLPMHGSGKELGTGLVNKIKKDLGLK
jgi:mRNA interferase HicA